MLCTWRDSASPTRSPTSPQPMRGQKARPRKCQGPGRGGSARLTRAPGGGSTDRRRSCARLRLSRLQPRAMARARGSGCGTWRPGVWAAQRGLLPIPAVAAPSVRCAAAARPGGDMASSFSSRASCPGAPRSSSGPPPLAFRFMLASSGPGSPSPSPRTPRRCPRQGTARPDERGCGPFSRRFSSRSRAVLLAQPRVLPVPLVPRADGLPDGSPPSRRTAPPAAVGRRLHGLASPRRRRCRHPHERGLGGLARLSPPPSPPPQPCAWWRHHACATSVPSQPRRQRRGPRGRASGAGEFGPGGAGQGSCGGGKEVAGGGCWLEARVRPGVCPV